MGKYIKGQDRNQMVLFSTSLDDMITSDNEVRVIDLFVDSLDLEKIGITRAKPKNEGKPGYDPKDLLKLYIYGYLHKVRSSRKLMELSRVNIEVIWLLKQLTPDFRTISDFRKDNVKYLKKIFVEFNLVCKEINILDVKETSQDGTKIRAVNAKDKNFTLNKVDDRIKNLEEKIDEYLKMLETADAEEKAEKLIKKEELEKRKAEYESYKKEMEEKGINQKSLTDPESKLMKDNGAFRVCYNMQTLLGIGNHFVLNFQITDQPADFGSMMPIVEETEKIYDKKVEENVTDNGYSDREDMVKCLENGTFPQVTPGRDSNGVVLETEYEEAEITEEIRKSREKGDIKKCLRGGIIPEVYEGKIESIEIKEVTETRYIGEEEYEKMTEEEMRDKAMHEGLFIRDIEKNKVYCPGGCILRQKSKHGKGIKYCNKLGCKNCKNPCTQAAFKEVVFNSGQKTVKLKQKKEEEKKLSTGTSKGNKKRKTERTKVKKVFISLISDKEKLSKRMCTSEHHHGSMKRWDDAGYALLKGKEKVTGEVALYFCTYNIRRAINLIGVSKLIEYFKKKMDKIRKEVTISEKNLQVCLQQVQNMQ